MGTRSCLPAAARVAKRRLLVISNPNARADPDKRAAPEACAPEACAVRASDTAGFPAEAVSPAQTPASQRLDPIGGVCAVERHEHIVHIHASWPISKKRRLS